MYHYYMIKKRYLGQCWATPSRFVTLALNLRHNSRLYGGIIQGGGPVKHHKEGFKKYLDQCQATPSRFVTFSPNLSQISGLYGGIMQGGLNMDASYSWSCRWSDCQTLLRILMLLLRPAGVLMVNK